MKLYAHEQRAEKESELSELRVYNTPSKAFHWITALLVLVTAPMGLYMVWLEPSPFKFDIYQWHKSVGMTIFLLVIMRVGWNLASTRPKPLTSLHKWEVALSKTVHILMYLALFIMPLTGWLMTSAGQFPNKYFGLFDIPDLVGKNDWLFEVMRESHEIIAFIFLAAIVLHVTGGLKHYILDRDQTLQRMLPVSGKRAQKAFTFGMTFFVFLSFLVSGGLIYQLEIKDTHTPDRIAGVKIEKQEKTLSQASPSVEAWSIDKDKSRIGFSVEVEGSKFEGEFLNYDGTIIFDPDNLDSAKAEIDVRIESVKSGSKDRDSYIVQEPWLHADKHSFARFTSSDFQKSDTKDYVVTGDFTLKGVTKKIEMPFHLDITEKNDQKIARASGQFKIDRKAHTIGTGPWAQGDTVGESVTIQIDLTARK